MIDKLVEVSCVLYSHTFWFITVVTIGELVALFATLCVHVEVSGIPYCLG